MKKISILLAIGLFAAIALWYGRPVDGIWNSPDETANAFWAARVATGQPLEIVDAFVGLSQGAMHPRSMHASDVTLVPGSFPGIFMIYGVFGFLFRLPFHVYTPILTILAGCCVGALAARLFDRKVGVLATLLFFVHPAVLYYGARGMFHNMLFVDLLAVAAAMFALRPLRAFFGARETADDAIGGFVLAWALVVRTSEAVWVIPAFAAFLPFAGKGRWRRLAVAVAGGIVPLLILLRLDATLYGSPFRTAYAPPAVTAAETSLVAPSEDAAPVPVPKALLPFGVHPRLVARNVWHYGFELFWWQTALAVLGLAWWMTRLKKSTAPQRTYAIAVSLAALWLAVLYGSWFVKDRLDPGQVTIGTSYVRYFLPAYVAALPFAAFALDRLGSALRKPRVVPVILALCAAFGVHLSVFAGDEGLRAVRATLIRNAEKKRALLALIEPEAVVMTERFDKLLVPERMRIIPASDAGAFAAAARAAAYVPVYWYGLRPGADEALRLESLAESEGLVWHEIEAPAEGDALFALEPTIDDGGLIEDATYVE